MNRIVHSNNDLKFLGEPEIYVSLFESKIGYYSNQFFSLFKSFFKSHN